jgi:hypothetical protein
MLLTTLALITNQAAAGDGVKVRPHIKPILSGQSFMVDDDRYNALNIGGAAGVKFSQKKSGLKMMGLTRAQYVKTVSFGDTTGQDLRVGMMAGPWWRIAGVQFGVDAVQNSYSNAVVDMPQAFGVNPVASALIDLRLVNVSLIAGPTYYMGDQRQAVNWDAGQYDFPGFGDEFFYKARAGFSLLLLNVGFTYSTRYTAYGVEQMVGVGVGL